MFIKGNIVLWMLFDLWFTPGYNEHWLQSLHEVVKSMVNIKHCKNQYLLCNFALYFVVDEWNW